MAAEGTGATSKRFDKMHKTRFIEIFLAHRDAKTGKPVAECYTSMFTSSGIPASKDTSPQGSVQGLDFDAIKKEFAVGGASLNGPKRWLPDWTEIEVGVERTFNGIVASWIAQLKMGDKAGGVATIMADEFFNVYHKTGPGMSNDKP